MRVILFFDLPVVEAQDRNAASKFRRDIMAMGFLMLQESVYVKFVLDGQSAKATIQRVCKLAPHKGDIFALTMTEKQFTNMNIILGEGFATDCITGDAELVIL